jgi:hypothetical protein
VKHILKCKERSVESNPVCVPARTIGFLPDIYSMRMFSSFHQYFDAEPSTLSYDEFEKCYKFFSDFLYPFEWWQMSGLECAVNGNFSDLDACPNYGDCARREYEKNKAQQDSPYICCNSGTSFTYYVDADSEVVEDRVCDTQWPGANCLDSSMCESSNCVDGFCFPRRTNSSDSNSSQVRKELGQPCQRDHEVCMSGFCWDGVCQQEPTICPVEDLLIFGGLRLDAYCRPVDEWCTINDWEVMTEVLFYGYGENVSTCYEVLAFYANLGNYSLIKLVDETAAEIHYIYEDPNYNDIENLLIDSWTYYVLICIAIVGFFALVSNVRWLLQPDTDNRARDYKIKCAAAFKIGKLIENALSMHPVAGTSSKGQIMVSMHIFSLPKISLCPSFSSRHASETTFFEARRQWKLVGCSGLTDRYCLEVSSWKKEFFSREESLLVK